MTQPAVDPNWASDTNFSSGTETGTPTKVSPGAGPLAQGFVPGNKFVGPYINYTLYWICQWITTYLKVLHTQTVGFLDQAFDWTGGHSFAANVRMLLGAQLENTHDILYCNGAGAATPRSVTRAVPWNLTSYNGVVGWSVAGAGNIYGTVADGGGQYPVMVPVDKATLPQGATLNNVRGWGNDNNGTLTVTFGYYPITHSSGVIGAFVTLATGTSTGANTLVGTIPNASGLAHTVDYSSRRYVFSVVSTLANATVNDLYVVFDDRGFTGN